MKPYIRTFVVCLIFFPAAAFPSSDPAFETRMSPTVVTSTLTEKALEDAPGSVQVITAGEIESLGAVTLSQALEQAVGLVVASDTGRAKALNIRGTGNRQSLVLIDGRRLSQGYKDFTDMNQIPVSMIQRIEILRGPGSAIYGSDAIGGVVNVITRTPPEKPSAGLSAKFGGHSSGDGMEAAGAAWVGTRAGKAGFLLSADLKEKEGWDEDGLTPDDGDHQTLGSGAGRFTWDLGAAALLSAGFEYARTEREGSRLYQGEDRERDAEDKRLNYYLQYDNKSKPGQNLMVRAYRSEHEDDIEFSPEAPVTAEEDAQRWLHQVEARYSQALGSRHLLFLGGEFRQEGREDSDGADHDLDNAGLFIQDEIRITDPLYLVAGLRYDNHSEFGGRFTPRGSLVFTPREHLRIKAAVGTGFRAPSISELFVTSYRNKGKYVYQPNPDLEPEDSVSWELGIEGESGRFRGGITGFRNDIDNLIEAVFQNTVGSGKKAVQYYQYRNLTEARTQGIEFEAGLDLPMHLGLDGSLTWMETENRDTGSELEGHPDLKGTLALTYTRRDLGLKGLLRLDYFGSRYYAGGDEGGYCLLNIFLSKQITPRFRVFAGVDNILDREESRDGITYIEPASLYAGFNITY